MHRFCLYLAMMGLCAGASAEKALVLVDNGASPYRIVVPDDAAPNILFAAKELQTFLSEITGATLPILQESKASRGPAIYLGPCKRSERHIKKKELAALKEDGVLIKSAGKNLYLTGQNARGQVYSVYVLLERFMDVRFLTKDCNVVPKQATLKLTPIHYAYSPSYMYREVLYADVFPKTVSARMRLNGPTNQCDDEIGGKVQFFPYVHSANSLVPPDKYFATHPEYYALSGGKRITGPVHAQLCWTNPDVLRIATEQVMKWIKDNPSAPIIDVSQNDGNGWCECDACKKVVDEEGSQHGPIMRFVNAIADEVAKEYPDKWIETLAYAYAIKPGAITKPRPNVIIRLCHAGCYFHGFEKCDLGSHFAEYLNEWGQRTSRIFIWHYTTNFGHYLAPCQNLDGLARDLKYYATHNVNGVMVQGDYQASGGELADLRAYLSAQLLWDPSRDPIEVRSEFCKGYYGPAAGAVLEFLAVMDEYARDPNLHAFANWDPTTTVRPDMVKRSLDILTRARGLVQSPDHVNRVEKLMLPFWYMQLSAPDKYGLAPADAPALVEDCRRVIQANGIVYVAEGPTTEGWLNDMTKRYGQVGETKPSK